jgi:catechol 2,3-dioxygenase-like lactoylglutathione lyase family enzyme
MKIDLNLGTSVGVAVRDLGSVVDFYQEGLGLGPFEIEEVEAPTAHYCGGGTSTARVAPAKWRVATAPLGVCELELIEVIAGRPPHAEFLESEGEGMNHFNLDKLTAEGYLGTLSDLYTRGIEPFWGFPFGSFCYVESESIGGVTFEVMVGSGHAGKKGHNHLGLVVEQTQRTIDFYSERLGLGPFRTGEYPMPRAFYREKRIEAGFRASFCDLGESRLRLYQVLEGETPISERLANRNEGMHHLCLHVADLEESLVQLATQGIEPTWRCPERRTAHLDTTAIGGMIFALAESI